MNTLNESSTLIGSINLIATGNIPSQIEIIGEPIYINGKISSFKILHQPYNYSAQSNLECSIENFTMSSSALSICTFKFSNYFTFNVIEEGKVEFEICVFIENVHDELMSIIDDLFASDIIVINSFIFKDDEYFIESNMNVVEIVKAEIVDVY